MQISYEISLSGQIAGLAAIIDPSNQSIFTVSAAKTITASRSGKIYANGVDIGLASPSLSWTPGAINYNIDLIAGSGSRASAPIKVAVAEANHIAINLTTWTASGMTVTSGETDPYGGAAAYKLTCAVSATAASHNISKAGSPASTAANGGFEIWAEYNASLPVLLIYPLDGGATHYAYINLLSGDTMGNFSACKIVETRGNWKRIWFSTAQGAICNDMILYGCKTIGATADITNGTEFIRLYLPRLADGILPLTNYQRSHVRSLGVVSNLDRWAFRDPLIDTIADVNTDYYIDVLKPTSYNSANKYPVIYVGEVEPTTNVYADSLQTIRTLGLHDTHNVIFVRSYTKSIPWFGTKSDGTRQVDIHYRDVVVGLMDERYSTIKNREGRMFLGFSKSGFGALSILLRNPTVFGYAAAWDVPWNLVYGDFETIDAFGTSAQFNLYNPKTILTSYLSSVNDKSRIVLAGSASFSADTISFDAYLTTNNVPHAYVYNLLGGGGADHNWNTGWLTNVVAALMALR